MSYLFLTPWNRAIEKLTGLQLVKNFPHLIKPKFSLSHSKVSAKCPYSKPVQCTPYPNIPLPEDQSQYYPPVYAWVSQINPLFQISHNTTAYVSPLSHTLYMPCLPHSSRFDNPNNIWCTIETIKLFIMQLPPLPCYHVPHKEKYSPQHPILSHPQPTFLPQYERPSFTPIQSNKDNYYCVCLNF